LVQELAPLEELDATGNSILGHLIRGAPAAQASAKDLIRSVAGLPHTAAQVAEGAKRFAALRGAEECREGLAAFLEKREPAWVARNGGATKTRRKR
jgi:methylglutaconyl-CoA hydratase